MNERASRSNSWASVLPKRFVPPGTALGLCALLCALPPFPAAQAAPGDSLPSRSLPGQSRPGQSRPPQTRRPGVFVDFWPILSLEAAVFGRVADVEVPSGVDPATLIRRSVTIAFEIQEQGRVAHLRVTQSSGAVELDDACVDAIRRTRFLCPIQDHRMLRSPAEITFRLP